MDKILLSPPVAFLIMLGVVTLFTATLSAFSLKAKKRDDGEGKSYACGEDVPTHLMQPDYSQFFPFAFFFTVLHVVALMIATVPVETMESFAIAIIYIAGAMVGMVILFRR
jgi:NADH:ubiquinone oxidoreductase subunit 3 (subunit A)